MATTFKIRYKNHCTPQEQILENGRYYLDSDCGRKLTGDSETSATIGGIGAYGPNLVVTSIPSYAISSQDFIFIKNTGRGSGNDVLVTLNNSNYQILLSAGEAFASEISTSAIIRAKCAADEDSTIEWYAGA